MTSQPDMVIYGTRKKHEATGRIRIRSPPRLPLELSMSIRDAAVKAFMVTPSRLSSLHSLQQNDTSAPRALRPCSKAGSVYIAVAEDRFSNLSCCEEHRLRGGGWDPQE